MLQYLREEGVEAVISSPDRLVAGHLAIRLDAVLQAVELPAGVADLDPGLADMYADTLPLEQIKLSQTWPWSNYRDSREVVV